MEFDALETSTTPRPSLQKEGKFEPFSLLDKGEIKWGLEINVPWQKSHKIIFRRFFELPAVSIFVPSLPDQTFQQLLIIPLSRGVRGV
ncbi:MAG: hypothetical protein WC788_05705 [Candidatus Paceibacterota bacterium]|jgi:hypothetical protein